MRIFVGGICQETNSLSPMVTTLADFRAIDPRREDPAQTEAKVDVAFGLSDVVTAVRSTSHELIIGFYADADPSQPVARAGYESMRARLVESFHEAGKVDAVLLFLHGAQVAEGYPDCEGDVLRALREAAGPLLPIGVLLDLHANLTPEMIRHATVVSACWEYPHVDLLARSAEIIKVLAACVAGTSRPTICVQPIAAVALLPTATHPGSEVLEQLQAMRLRPGILSVSLCHGFAHADVPAVGAAAIVVAEAGTAGVLEIARSLAQTFLRAARSSRIIHPPMDREAALDRALSSKGFPVVIADRSDNPGGGAPSDATYFLEAIRRRGLDDIALALFFSPLNAQRAIEVGVGGSATFRLEGANRAASGPTFEFDGRVTALSSEARQRLFGVGPWRSLGHSAALAYEGVKIVVNDDRQQVHSHECFSCHGIDLAKQRIVIVKSMAHFLTDFSKLCPVILFADGPGAASPDLRSLNLQHVRRPLWPLDAIDETEALRGAAY